MSMFSVIKKFERFNNASSKGDLMKINEIDLDFVKGYLRVDHNEGYDEWWIGTNYNPKLYVKSAGYYQHLIL